MYPQSILMSGECISSVYIWPMCKFILTYMKKSKGSSIWEISQGICIFQINTESQKFIYQKLRCLFQKDNQSYYIPLKFNNGSITQQVSDLCKNQGSRDIYFQHTKLYIRMPCSNILLSRVESISKLLCNSGWVTYVWKGSNAQSEHLLQQCFLSWMLVLLMRQL